MAQWVSEYEVDHERYPSCEKTKDEMLNSQDEYAYYARLRMINSQEVGPIYCGAMECLATGAKIFPNPLQMRVSKDRNS